MAVGVVGTGQMALGIATVAVLSGRRVVMCGRTEAASLSAKKAVAAWLATRVEKGKMDIEEARACEERMETDVEAEALSECDVVIESVVENLEVKKGIFARLGKVCKQGALLATNTSTLPVAELAMASGRPESVCGLHFFNPAPAMALVEVVKCITTSDATLETATAFAKECGKTPVVVKDRAGFVVNNLLVPMINSAINLLDAGVATKEGIDACMKLGCGHPMGPLALADLIGLDTVAAIMDALHRETGRADHVAAPLLRRLVASGCLGKKARRGFYVY